MHRLFPSQLEDEKIYMVVRQHWVRLAVQLFIWVVFAVLPTVLRVYYSETSPDLFDNSTTMGRVVTLFQQIYDIFLLLALFVIWLMYYLNIQVITDRRIVDIDQVGLFSHTISELHIENIEDVTSETNGILGNIFDYGMVYVQTAGALDRFEFNNVPHPGIINKTILDLYEKLPHHKAGGKGKD